MILDNFKNKFVVVAHRGFSALHPDSSMLAFEAAVDAGADFIETDIRKKSGVLVCSHDAVTTDKAVVTLDELLEFSQDKIPLLLDLKSKKAGFSSDVLKTVESHNMTDQVIFGVRSLRQATETRHKSEQVGILGFLENPADFPAFYSVGGNIARLWEGDLTPLNLKLAEAAVGPHRRPVWTMAGFYPNEKIRKYGDASVCDIFNIINKGAKGVLVNDPTVALEALRRKAAPLPACASCAPD